MSLAALSWPAGVPIAEADLYVETLTARYRGSLSAHEQTGARIGSHQRAADRWAGAVTVEMAAPAAGAADALVARLRGPAGAVLVPVHHHPTVRGTLASFDAYAAEIGPTRFDDATGWDDGRVFFEGAGTPRLLGGWKHQVVFDGCYPFVGGIFATADLLQTNVGQAVLITRGDGPTTNFEGTVVYPCAPTLREPVLRGPVSVSGVTLALRLRGDAAVSVETVPPAHSRYTLTLIEVL